MASTSAKVGFALVGSARVGSIGEISDSGVATETALVLVISPVSVFDSGVGADQVSITEIAVLIIDQGTGADQPTVIVSASVSDNGGGADAFSLVGDFSISDGGLSLEALSSVVQLFIADSGAGSSQPLVHTGLSVVDQGVGEDVVSVDAVLSVLDAGGLVPDARVGTAIVGRSRVGRLGEFIHFPKSVADSGVFTDLPYVSVTLPTLQDLGSLDDDVLPILAQVRLTDSLSAEDVLAAIQASLLLRDAGIVLDITQLQALLLIADSAEGLDEAFSAVLIGPIDDSGSSSDALEVLVMLSIAEWLLGEDVLIRTQIFIPPFRVVINNSHSNVVLNDSRTRAVLR